MTNGIQTSPPASPTPSRREPADNPPLMPVGGQLSEVSSTENNFVIPVENPGSGSAHQNSERLKLGRVVRDTPNSVSDEIERGLSAPREIQATPGSTPPPFQGEPNGDSYLMSLGNQLPEVASTENNFVIPVENTGSGSAHQNSERTELDRTVRDTHKSVFDEIERDLYASREGQLSKVDDNLRLIDAAEEKALNAIFVHSGDVEAVRSIYHAGKLAARYGVADIAVALSELRINGGDPAKCDKLEKSLCDLIKSDGLKEKSGFAASYVGNSYQKVQKLIEKINKKLDVVLDKKDIFSSVLKREVMPAIRQYLTSRMGKITEAEWEKISAADGLASRAARIAADGMTTKMKTFEKEGGHTALHAKVNQWRVAQRWCELMRATSMAKRNEQDAPVKDETSAPPTRAPLPTTRPASEEAAHHGNSYQANPIQLNFNGFDKELVQGVVNQVVEKYRTQDDLDSAWLYDELKKELSLRTSKRENPTAKTDLHASEIQSNSPNRLTPSDQKILDFIWKNFLENTDLVAAEIHQDPDGNSPSSTEPRENIPGDLQSDENSNAMGTSNLNSVPLADIGELPKISENPVQITSKLDVVPLPSDVEVHQKSSKFDISSSQKAQLLSSQQGNEGDIPVEDALSDIPFLSVKERVRRLEQKLPIFNPERSSHRIGLSGNATTSGEFSASIPEPEFRRLNSRKSFDEDGIRSRLSTASRPELTGPSSNMRRSNENR